MHPEETIYKDRFEIYVEKLGPGFYVSGYGPDGSFKTYKATEEELKDFLDEKIGRGIAVLAIAK